MHIGSKCGWQILGGEGWPIPRLVANLTAAQERVEAVVLLIIDSRHERIREAVTAIGEPPLR